MDEKIDDKTKYKEGSASLRHYSTTILNIRTVTIVQGLVLIGSIMYLIQNEYYGYLIFTSVFGMLFTATLFIFNNVYLSDFESILNYLVRELENETGPWGAYNRNRENRLRNRFTHPIAHHGIFTLLGGVFFSMFIYSFFKCLFS